ncbi:MAG: anti-sigma regulatory factor, partial [Armatimonadia bacterium]|nr:anti-sigma regulatory factor [Armatimonadia bacterium]
ITHGYEEAGLTGDILVETAITTDEVRLTLVDSAIPFDPRSHNRPGADDLGRPAQERQIGGLGVHLALESVDGFEYEHRDGRNRNTLIVNRGTTN